MTASATVAGPSSPDSAGALTPSRAAVWAGPVDHLHRDQILALVDEVPMWRRNTTATRRDHQRRVRGTQVILDWLLTYPGAGWQERWLASGADHGTGWISQIAAPRRTGRSEVCMGVNALLLCRVVLPGYGFIASYHPTRLKDICRLWCPDQLAWLPDAAAAHGMDRAQQASGVHVITKIVLHTGKDIGQLTADDLTGYRQWHQGAHGKGRVCAGYYAAWDLLRGIGVLPPDVPLQFAQRQGQASTADMVDHYQISNPQIRGVLIRYLDERRPGLDYSTLRSLATALAGQFWADIERHHPGIATLHLPADVAQAWKQRLSFLTAKPGQPRKDTDNLLTAVRAFYLDIQEWALEDPSWAPWAVPSPVRKSDTAGRAKRKKNVTSRMHQRVRERLPHLPALAASAGQHRTSQHAFLAAAKNTAVGETFEHGGVTYRRIASRNSVRQPARYPIPPALVVNTATGKRTDVTRAEDDAFWTWAIIETLRHTGVRIEELLEITHLALISYRLPGTGELIPMLQIVPSKSNEERLLLVTPELASALAAIITRLRGATGSVPVVARYDDHERLTGPRCPTCSSATSATGGDAR